MSNTNENKTDDYICDICNKKYSHRSKTKKRMGTIRLIDSDSDDETDKELIL